MEQTQDIIMPRPLLPEESRKKAVKLYLLNLTIEEISILLNWSKDKARNLLYRGLADLKHMLRKKGIEYENR